jgi:proline iminopeptidase
MTPSSEIALPVAGAVLHVVVLGSDAARPLLVFHGGPGEAHDCLRPHLDRLASPRRCVVYYDQRGGGRSALASGEEPAGWQAHVADVEAVRRHLGAARVDVLGFSWGSLLAILHALEHPARVARMVLVSPPPLRPDAGGILERNLRAASARPEVLALRARLAPIAGGSDEAARRARFALKVAPCFADPARAMDVTPVESCEDVAAAINRSLETLDIRPRLAALRSVPSLIVHGAADVVPTATAAETAESIGAELCVLDRCGHAPFVEAEGPFFAAVEAFLDGDA